jgi:hypothetical protein
MKIKPILFALMASLSLALMSGCSEDQSLEDIKTKEHATKHVADKAKSVHNPFDHSHDEAVTDVVKHQFEHEFADQCVARELKISNNPDVDKPRLDKDCMCIAKYMMKDLSSDEARKFLKQHENTHSLRIKFDAAAYFCLQNKQQPKGPKIFGRP